MRRIKLWTYMVMCRSADVLHFCGLHGLACNWLNDWPGERIIRWALSECFTESCTGNNRFHWNVRTGEVTRV